MRARPRRLSVLIPALLLFPLLLVSHAGAAASNANIYLVALNDNGQSGMQIGCLDSLIPVQTQIQASGGVESRISAALTALFAIHDQFYGQSGLYNGLHLSTLSVANVTMGGPDGHTAVVHLSGTMASGGICDDPRIEQQVEQTILQFPGVWDTTVYLGDRQLFVPVVGQYFDVTGHWVTGRFQAVWNGSGGLPVFGYPMSGRLDQNNLMVQYFERQRFELHPNNAAPYDVLLGLLGTEAAQQRGLMNTAPFQPLPATTQSNANCTFFAATGHRLCFGFRAYWQSHGLEFGDPGVSYREALALFGYPISEEFTDPATGLTTQYFQRAVFQYQPNNQPPWDILLQRLGADQLAATK
ncbi:MAG TPA: hypothetical protein VFI42_21090 [Thermomicrobiaceae bacterium]|nr:hypothetical protein [Thermomicrobiaceae bacterium]